MTVPTPTPNLGKRPRTVLAGPYGHPFHPILVTVPIGAWIASLQTSSSRAEHSVEIHASASR